MSIRKTAFFITITSILSLSLFIIFTFQVYGYACAACACLGDTYYCTPGAGTHRCTGGEICCPGCECSCGMSVCPDGCNKECTDAGCRKMNDASCAKSCNCFAPDTGIAIPCESCGEKNIDELKVGDEIKSYDENSNTESTSIVENIYEATRGAYYKIKLKSGELIKVTEDHPLYGVEITPDNLSLIDYLINYSFSRKIINKINSIF